MGAGFSEVPNYGTCSIILFLEKIVPLVHINYVDKILAFFDHLLIPWFDIFYGITIDKKVDIFGFKTDFHSQNFTNPKTSISLYFKRANVYKKVKNYLRN